MSHPQFYSAFTDNLTKVLLQQATQEGLLAGQLLTTDDFDAKWNQIAPEYMADAVPEVHQYPSVAVAWAAYVGMGVAMLWDTEWEKHTYANDTYTLFRNPRGFDAMDEYIMAEIMGIAVESTDFGKVEDFLRNAAHTAMTMIRKENFPPDSIEAYRIFSDAVTVMFKLGASMCLYGRGYSYQLEGN